MSILEAFSDLQDSSGNPDRNVRGLARMVQISPSRTLVDLTVHGLASGTYHATIRQYGNLEQGATSTGPIWTDGDQERGFLGSVEVSEDGKGTVFVDHPFEIWETIGHAMVLTKQNNSATLENDENTVVGVIARSAGMWENDKTVCSCTGKTLWEERKVETEKGML